MSVHLLLPLLLLAACAPGKNTLDGDDDDTGAGDTDEHEDTDDGLQDCFLDGDGDGFGGDTLVRSEDCGVAGLADDDEDCDDGDADVHPGGVEVCGSGADEDCDGQIDEDCEVTWEGELDPNVGAFATIRGSGDGDSFGRYLAPGDFDGDGAGDLLVGSPGGDAGSGTSWGVVFGYYGPSAAGVQADVDHDAVAYANDQSAYSGAWGARVQDVGDLDGDGAQDVLVTQSGETSSIFYGGATGDVLPGARDGTRTCSLAASAGDYDGASGTDELACASATTSSSRGAVYVFAGASESAVMTFSGENSGDSAGFGVTGGGDVDGDGYDDVWVGAPYHDVPDQSAGKMYLVLGPTSGGVTAATADATINGAGGFTYLGWSLIMPGDVDRDGYDDVVAGGIGYGGNAGAAFVFTSIRSGAHTSSEATAVLAGEVAGDKIGEYTESMSSGDVDGDGNVDLLLGSYRSGGEAGAAWLAFGPFAGTSTLSASSGAVWRASTAYDRLGLSVAVVPDADGDGRDEVALAAPNADGDGHTDNGVVWIWSL